MSGRTKMNSDELKSLVKKSENAAVEFKRARGGKFMVAEDAPIW